jgi:kynurenine formamidase
VSTIDEQMDWIRGWLPKGAFGERDRLGSASWIDEAAHLRAARSIVQGKSVSLGRPLHPAHGVGVSLEASVSDLINATPLRVGTDEVTLRCHGVASTHVDGLNHVSYDGTWYGGWDVHDPDGPSVADWAAQGLFTRAVHVDLGAVRGTEWVGQENPVTGTDIDAALRRQGLTFERGDALLLDMGRDLFEAAGNVVGPGLMAEQGVMQPGLGRDGAEWIGDHHPAVVCWDFLEAVHPEQMRFSAHALIWALGQIFVDNCTFAGVRSATRARELYVGALAVAPLPLVGATGCNVNPLFLY